MVATIFEALFYGQIRAWGRHVEHTPQRRALEQKIETEKQHFVEKMSLDDCQRFEALERLYMETGTDEQSLFAHGVTLGALFMLEVMTSRGTVINE